MSECNHDCSSCGQKCAQADLRAPLNPGSKVKHVIGVVSGKGGVGKSLVTGLSAVEMRRRGFNVAVLDADITGPSIPKMFGVEDKAMGNEEGILPVYTSTGIGTMSINLLLDDETEPVVWRGSLISGTVKQFWTDVVWGDVDYMFVDMPPGTGDVPLTVFQSLPVDGILIVTTPQDLVSMIVKKAVGMAKMMDVPILGVIENMSYIKCPHCGEEIHMFGKSHVEESAAAEGIPVVARIPIDAAMTAACDTGKIEYYAGDFMNGLAEVLPKI